MRSRQPPRIAALAIPGRSCADIARLADSTLTQVHRWARPDCDRSCMLAKGADALQQRQATTGSKISDMTPELLQLAAIIVERGGAVTAEILLKRTAPYVLHPRAPIDHLAAWLRFYVRKCGALC